MAKYLVSDKVWNKYRNVVQTFMDVDAGLQEITWLKHLQFPLPFGEDGYKDNFEEIKLNVLVNYNSFRIWPINVGTPSGDLDDMNCAILITKMSLEKRGYLDDLGYWVVDSILDRFLIDGKMYIPKGDTAVAQAKDKTLLFQITLKREDNVS